jgi:hypothetical protein
LARVGQEALARELICIRPEKVQAAAARASADWIEKSKKTTGLKGRLPS